MNGIKNSVLIFDIKNFTENLKKFESRGDDKFLLFVQNICKQGYDFYKQLPSVILLILILLEMVLLRFSVKQIILLFATFLV
jgi:hypothetical protein